MSTTAYLDIYIGDEQETERLRSGYEHTCALLNKNAAIYGLPATTADLTDEHKEILQDLEVRNKALNLVYLSTD